MPSPLAPTTISTSVDDSLITADVYGTSSGSSLMDTAGAATTGDNTDVAAFMGLDSATTDATAALPDFSEAEGTVMSSTDVLTGMIAPNSDLMSSYSSLDETLKAQLLSTDLHTNVTLADVTTPDIPAVVANATSAKNIQGLLGMVNSICGTIQAGVKIVENVAAAVALMSNLIKIATHLKVPNVYARFDDGCFSASIMGPVTKASLKVAVSSSSVNLLSNISKGSQAATASAMMPNFCSQFASTFKLAPGTPSAAHAQIGLDISSSFTRLNPSWASGKVGSNTLVNANLFVNASPDFKLVMAASSNAFRPLTNSAVTVTAGITAALAPKLNTISPNSLLNQSADATQIQVQQGNGSTQSYAVSGQDANGANLFTETSTDPVAATSQSWNAFDSSQIHDPMVLGSAFDRCMAGGDTKVGNSDPSLDTNLYPTTAVSPTADAGDSLQGNFPYLTLSNSAAADTSWA